MLLATGLYRASHLTAGITALVHAPASGVAVGALLGMALGTSLLLYGAGYAQGGFGPRLVWADVLLTGCLLPHAVLWASAGHVPGTGFWALLLGGSAAAAAAAGLGVRQAGCAVVLILAAHVAAQLQTDTVRPLTGHLVSVVSSAVMARVFWWYLHRQGTLLDEAREQAVRAEAERARQAERMAHHRALHDTVLATLTTIASGRVDANTPGVRERCAREAAYLRRLVQRSEREEAGEEKEGAEVPAGEALEDVVAAAECLGLTVTAQYHELPPLPGPVAAALTAAATEALNNVRRHAGTSAAYLTAIGRGGGITVTVVDRGRGFDAEAALVGGRGTATGTGTGLRRSMHARMREIGGAADVDSAPGEGTRVELRWPA
ncbi:sensor histidine kinase [Streptomyces sp. NPDC059567]|uniref:sensor histidine kinase n=1 Tax=Streptomyces sp. NPDC059567 TaxID=3346867 RepID=UPI00368E7D65